MTGTAQQSANHQFETAGAPPISTPTTLAAATPLDMLTLDFLAWVAGRPRSYAEAMEAWRTSCPRFPIWEDAIGDGLIRLEGAIGTTMSETKVVLTPRGRVLLDGA